MPVLFSSNLIIGKGALETMEPTTLIYWRWVVATLVLIAIAGQSLTTHAAVLLRLTPLLLGLAVLGMVICGAGVYIALRHTTATNGTLIYTTSPAFIVLFEMLIGRRPFSIRQFLGIVLATIGVAVIVFHGNLADALSTGLNPGDLGMLAGAISWAVYSVILHDRRLQALPDRAVLASIAICAVVALTPVWLIGGWRGGLVPASTDNWLAVAGVALMPSVLAYLSYQWLVRQVGAAVTGMALYFLPICGVSLAAIFLHEQVHLYHLFGTLLTLGGVIVATRLARQPDPAPA